jgi:molybdate transport system ATP-binding protein
VAVVVSGLEARVVVRRGPKFRLEAAIGVPDRTTVALLGPNGAGKSTLVWALAGAIPLDEGRITLGGRVLDDRAAGVHVEAQDRRIGAVFQDVLLFPHLTVAGNVAFALRRRCRSDREAQRSALEWLERFGLEGLADLRPARLSGGEAQQVGLARALAGEPALLLLDEPLSALDVAARGHFRRMLAGHLTGFPGPRLLITHDPAEAFLLADRVVVLEHGSVTQTGSPDDIRRHPLTAYAADLAGVNLLTGTARAGTVDVGSAIPLDVADGGADGPVLLTIHPRAISIHTRRPEGSPRNTWRSVIRTAEAAGERTRVQFGDPLPLTAEITTAAFRELGITAGGECWVAVKAAEIAVRPG